MTETECIRHKDPSDGDLLCSCACRGYGKVCPCATRTAEDLMDKETTNLYAKSSHLFRNGPTPFHEFDTHDLAIGSLLGKGGYCQVHSLSVKDKQGNTETYAIKFIKRSAMIDKKKYLEAAVDLALESNFLTALADSKHIVRLHGIATGTITTLDGGQQERRLFLVLDQLHNTLDNKLQQWKHERSKTSGIWNVISRLSQEHMQHRHQACLERLQVSMQIAEAMRYLHEKKVIYRDLKPENVGFCVKNCVKLFDFGVAVENSEGPISGVVGSLRYMAPEVAMGHEYNSKIDVYSFGIVLHEIVTLNTPFSGYDANTHMLHVVKGQERPRVDMPGIPEAMRQLMISCWDDDSAARPFFDEIINTLNVIVDTQNKASLFMEGSTNTSLVHIMYEVFQ